MSNLLVTGGLGYIGSQLVKDLNFSKYKKIIIVDLNLFDTKESLLNLINKSDKDKIYFSELNFSNISALEELFQKFEIDIVVHLGGLVGDPACAYNLKLTQKINVEATENIIDISIKYGVKKFIFASSCSVYGINEDVCSELTEPKPISEYAVSKLQGENKLKLLKNKFEEIIIFRFSTLYGVSERIRFDLVANLFYANARWSNKITLFGGWQWRPFLHVKDASIALCHGLEKNIKGFNIFNIGLESGNSTIENLAKLTTTNFSSCEIIDVGSGDDARNYKVNFDKFYSNFGNILKYDLEKGVRDLSEDLKLFEGKWSDVKYSNYLTTKKYAKYLLDNND